MSSPSGPNARLSPLHAVVLPNEDGVEEREEHMQRVYRDNQIAFLYRPDRTAEIRVHDEFTKGGRSLFIGSFPASNLPEMQVYPLTAASTIPVAFNLNSTAVYFDIDVGANDLDISDWMPAVAGPDVEFQFRKIDRGPGRLIYKDNTGVTYKFVDKYSEFITLRWIGTSGALRVI